MIKALDEINLFGHDGDVIGDAYEYLIGQFAAGAGKKAGEFYTPQAVSKIISEIVSIGQEHIAPFHIYEIITSSLIQFNDYLIRLFSREQTAFSRVHFQNSWVQAA